MECYITGMMAGFAVGLVLGIYWGTNEHYRRKAFKEKQREILRKLDERS